MYAPVPQPLPPAKPKTPAIVVILVVVAVLAMLVFIPLMIGVVIGIRKVVAEGNAKAKTDPAAEPLRETYKTQNGLLTVHYPSDFAAKNLDDATILVSRNFTDGSDELVTFGAVPDPITDDPHEFGRILLDGIEKNVIEKKGTYQRFGERPAQCLGTHPGIEIQAKFRLGLAGDYVSKSCFFMIGKVGYELRYDVPKSRADAQLPLLERIIDATELAPTPP